MTGRLLDDLATIVVTLGFLVAISAYTTVM